MSKKGLRIKRFEQRLQKTHERFGYISLDAIASSYFSYRKEPNDFEPIKCAELQSFSTYKENIPFERLEQMRKALHKANKVQKLKREAA
ncbi:hypothetical protein [Aliivibrio wodanis]|uniref:hypothetical protein n=1 Tax=Aliivibrio wodanis TaxID=80852 RepID=UPI00406C9405